MPSTSSITVPVIADYHWMQLPRSHEDQPKAPAHACTGRPSHCFRWVPGTLQAPVARTTNHTNNTSIDKITQQNMRKYRKKLVIYRQDPTGLLVGDGNLFHDWIVHPSMNIWIDCCRAMCFACLQKYLSLKLKLSQSPMSLTSKMTKQKSITNHLPAHP